MRKHDLLVTWAARRRRARWRVSPGAFRGDADAFVAVGITGWERKKSEKVARLTGDPLILKDKYQEGGSTHTPPPARL